MLVFLATAQSPKDTKGDSVSEEGTMFYLMHVCADLLVAKIAQKATVKQVIGRYLRYTFR